MTNKDLLISTGAVYSGAFHARGVLRAFGLKLSKQSDTLFDKKHCFQVPAHSASHTTSLTWKPPLTQTLHCFQTSTALALLQFYTQAATVPSHCNCSQINVDTKRKQAMPDSLYSGPCQSCCPGPLSTWCCSTGG